MDSSTRLPYPDERRWSAIPGATAIYADEMRPCPSPSPARHRPRAGAGSGSHGREVGVVPRGHAAPRWLLDLPSRSQRGDPRETEIALRRLTAERVITFNYDASASPRRAESSSTSSSVWDVDTNTDRTPTPPEQRGAARVHAPREEGRPAARGGLRGRGAPAAGDQHRHALPDPDIGRARFDPGGVRRLEPRGARDALPPPLPAALRVLRLLRQRGLRGDRGAARVGPARRAGGLRDLRDRSPRREGVR